MFFAESTSACLRRSDPHPVHPLFRFLIDICRKRSPFDGRQILLKMLRIERPHNDGVHMRMSQGGDRCASGRLT